MISLLMALVLGGVVVTGSSPPVGISRILKADISFVRLSENVAIGHSGVQPHSRRIYESSTCQSVSASERFSGSKVGGALVQGWKFAEIGFSRRVKNDSSLDIVRGRNSAIHPLNHTFKIDIAYKGGSAINHDVSTQLSARGGTRFPKSPDQQAGSEDAKDDGPKSVVSSIARGIRSFPLSAKVGLAFIVSLIAARILFLGADRVSDRGEGYRRGYVAVGVAGSLYVAVLGFWWLASPY